MPENESVTMEDLYWIWLHRTPGIGLRKSCRLLDALGGPEKAWSCPEEELNRIEGLTPGDCRALLQNRNADRLWEWARNLEKRGVRIVTRASREYPPLLNLIFDPPPLLYVRGNPAVLTQDAIAVVGARRCTDYGASAARACAGYLAAQGYLVVSGMARGIDSWGHDGALRAGGFTAAVLGCGVDRCYPPENRPLMERILAQGAVISEFAPGTEALPGHFPLRNRIISGMCRGVVIVEAAKKSGSLITADQALEQGREVFVVPGSIFSAASQGGHALVQQGAALLTSWEDIARSCPLAKRVKREHADRQKSGSSAQAEDDRTRILALIEPEGTDQESLCRRGNFAPARLQQAITLLELEGRIRRMPDQRFIKL